MKVQGKGIMVLLVALLLPVIGITSFAVPVCGGTAKDVGETALLQATHSYGRLPMSFEPNKGQVDSQVSYLSRGAGYNLFLTPEESVLVLRKETASPDRPDFQKAPHLRHAPRKYETPSVVRMKFPGANAAPVIAGKEQLPGKSNYLRSSDAGKWRTDVEQYGRVEYRDLYPGVDLVYYGNQSGKSVRLEHDYVVRPGSDPSSIRIAFEGVERIKLNESGDLVLHLPNGGELIQHAPVIYQESNGEKTAVSGRYVLHGGSSESPSVGFSIASYDSGKTLYIDPVLSYSTYLGGTDYDFANGIAVDSTGCAYITGWTYSADFPTKIPRQLGNAGGVDVFVAKLNAAGSALVYSTYIGGSGDDFGMAIAVDAAGVAYVTGYTDSTDFPVSATPVSAANAGLHDAFVFKINAAGTAVTYSTYLGGTGDDYAAAIAVDAAGAAYITGYTDSTNFPVTGPYQAANAGLVDGFAAKINAAGTAAVYATYVGGAGQDYPNAIALDSTGRAFIAGYTNSANYPTANAYQGANAGGWDAFVTGLAANGATLYYSTYIGGTGDEFAYGAAISVDSAAPNHSCVYLTGATSSADLPTKTPAAGVAYQSIIAGNYDGFVLKMDPALVGVNTLVYSTYLGGEDYDAGNAVVVDSANNAYVAGETWSSNFPLKGNPFQALQGGSSDGFVAQINATGSALTYGSYFGGADFDAVMAAALDATANLYVSGYTYSIDFPVVLPLAAHTAGAVDAFVAKIGAAAPPQPDLVVSALTVPTYGVAGQKVSISTTVKNQGVGTSAACKVGLYLSVTPTTTPWKDSRSVFLGSRSVPSLKLNAISTGTTTLPLSSTIAAGTYYVVAVADSGGSIQEGLETNNTLAKTMKVYLNRPDLVGTTVSGPTTGRLGQTISVTSAIKNAGYGAARNFYVGIYLSSDATITAADNLIGTRLVPSLPAGAGNSTAISVQIPTTLAPGTYYYGIIVDSGNDVVETLKTNNTVVGNKIVVSP